jgi:mRNA interferase HicA
MNYNAFRRLLEQLGAVVKEGKKHSKVYYKDKRSVLPRHGGKEMSEGLRKGILKQLGIKEPPR